MTTALVTGASGGIGRELAMLMATDGMDLVLVARNEGKLRALSGELLAIGAGSVDLIPLDLTQAGSVARIQSTLDGRAIDVLVNNAGRGDYGKFQDISWQRHASSLQLNIVALTELTHALLPAMLDANSGYIINIASTASFTPTPLMSVYGASKAYVLSMSEGLSFELRQTPVKVMAFCPGATQTGFAETADAEASNNFSPANTATASSVAQYAFDSIKKRKSGIVVHGLQNRIQAWLAQAMPNALVVPIANRVMRQTDH